MEDQLNLGKYYADALKCGEEHLIKVYNAIETQHSSLSARAYSRVFQIEKQSIDIKLLIGLPYNFPDDFPSVVIPEPYFSNIYPIPHLDSRQVLCTFDSEQAHPNSNNPNGVLDAVIQRAQELISCGMNKLNLADYMDEFDSYWKQEVDGEYLSLMKFGSEIKQPVLIYFDHPNWGKSIIIADSKLEGINWVLQSGGTPTNEYKQAIYLPLDSIGTPPFPLTNIELVGKLREHSRESLKPLLAFLNKAPRPSTIIFSIPGNAGKIVGVWEHLQPERIATSSYKGKKQVITHLKGFRPGKKNALLELTRDFGDLKISKKTIIRVDKERLFNRGGIGVSYENLRVGILGCGSIGSHITESLLDFGIDKYLLIDNDVLTFENIARHVNGAIDVGQRKVDALKRFIISRFPNCEVTAYSEEISKMLLNYETSLDYCDFSVVSLGNLPIEFRINKLLRQKVITKPILFVWVEPYLSGAHAVWIDPNKDGCLQCLFDENHSFIRSVLANPGQYSKREAGCRSTYVPYGIVEVKRFVNDLTFFIQDILSGGLHSNSLFTWFGNLKLQKEQGRKISPLWAGVNNYSIRITPVSEISVCEGCLN